MEPSAEPSAEPSEELPCVDICVLADDESRKVCQDILASDSTPAGAVCIESFNEDGEHFLNVSYTSYGNWTFVYHEFWIGENFTELPQDADGEPDFETFPFYWCNSSGSNTWVAKVDLKWEYICEEESGFNLSIVSQSTLGRLLENGTILEDSEYTVMAYNQQSPGGSFGWFDFELFCECPPTEPCVPPNVTWPNVTWPPTNGTIPDICVDVRDGSYQECHDILAGGSVVVGAVCVKVTDEVGLPYVAVDGGIPFLDITFTATGNWTFVTNEIWIGENISSLPIFDGELDTENFPYYWCNSSGQVNWTTITPLKWSFNCEDLASFGLAFVAQSTLGQLLEDGTVDHDSEIVAYAYEHEGTNTEGFYGWFNISILCECVDEDDITPSTIATCEPSIVLVDEDFEAGEDESSWHEGSEYSWYGGITTESAGFGHFLGRLGEGNAEVSQVFVIPSAGGITADSVSLEFNLYQIDNWESTGDAFIVVVGGTEVSLGNMLENVEGEYLNGEVGGVSWSRTTTSSGSNLGFLSANDSVHFVQLEISAGFFSSGILRIDFKAITSSDIDLQSAGVDNFKLTARYSCTARRQLDGEDCNGTYEITNDTFESGISDGWDAGLIAQDETNGHFLGRMGQENPATSKTFDIPAMASSVTVSFAIYQFGSWDSADRVIVGIGSAHVDLQELGEAAGQGGSVDGVSWSSTPSGNFKGRQVSLSVPASHFMSGKMTMAFSFALSDSISIKSGGIDDLVITANGLCNMHPHDHPSAQFGMANFNKDNAGEPSMDGNDGSGAPYCSAQDFPCEGGEKVYVCHYSVFKGYTTFCVKETDAHIIRFYPNDYCGPCVGGYGSMKQ